MKAIILKISFFEAHFKVHYTKGYRLSYPVPLPTSIAGIFGALLGVERGDIKDKFSNFLFGGSLNKIGSENYENVTFIQIGNKKFKNWPPGVVKSQILNEPEFTLIMATSDENKFTEYFNKLEEQKFVYLPYGGQNDFFVKNIELIGTKEVEESDQVINYAPKFLVKKTEIDDMRNSFLYILPVMHKFEHDESDFYFIYGGKLFLKEKIPAVDNIGLYELSKFYYPTQE